MDSKTIGVLAHVDAGKTTLIESVLFCTSMIRKQGRVDHKDAFLDTDELEKLRGITIYSKQAFFDYNDNRYFLLDTPGHVDFATQVEKSVVAMDYALLVVSGVDKVQSHTITLWNLLKKNNIPVFIFINKMDMDGCDKDEIMKNLCSKLSDNCVDFSKREDLIEDVVSNDEDLMELYFESSDIGENKWYALIANIIRERKVFPCFFGSALRNEGIDRLLECIDIFTRIFDEKYLHSLDDCYSCKEGFKFKMVNMKVFDNKAFFNKTLFYKYDLTGYDNNSFNNKSLFDCNIGVVFNVFYGDDNRRLVYIKMVNGIFKVKDIIGDEKINEIRIYNGSKYVQASEVESGNLCAVTGLENVKIGDLIIDDTIFKNNSNMVFVPVLKSKVIINDDTNLNVALMNFKLLEDEEPMLKVELNDVHKEIEISVMGKIQLEVLKEVALKRFNMNIDFGKCEIVYKETIKKPVMGVGHFEPLRHYSEAHIRIEPIKSGSGIEITSECKTDILDKNHQNSIMHSLDVKEHKGILTGSTLTDVRLVLVKGKAHLKHTEGGDFYKASTRAVRQGLFMLGEDNCVLLEPFYSFEIEVPIDCIGRVMSDISKMYGEFEEPIIEGEKAFVCGRGPVDTFLDYPLELTSFSKGEGRISYNFCGYFKCHNEQEVIEKIGYNKDEDLDNPEFSVFCSHGAGFNVHWNEVRDYAHLEIEDV